MDNEQKNRLIAEKVFNDSLVYDGDAGYYLVDTGDGLTKFEPRYNANQAIKALEAWLIAGNGKRDYDASWCKDEGHIFMLSYEGYLGYYESVAEATNKELSAAICDALIEATKEAN